MKWRVLRLDSVTEHIRNGLSIQQSASMSGIPITRIETISNETIDAQKVGYADLQLGQKDEWLLRHGDILFSHINSEAHIGKCAIYTGKPKPLIHGMNLLSIRANQKLIEPKFLFYVIRSPKFRRQLPSITKRAVNQASISLSDLSQLSIPLPPLSEQRRIVEILDQADALRKKRAEADEKAKRILPALFYKMFGDPATNPKGWEVKRLDSLTKVIHRYPTFYGQDYVDVGIPVVRISDILENHILNRDINQYVKVPKEFSDQYPLTLLEPQDIVMAVRGDTTGKIGLVPDELTNANISPNLIRISPDKSKVTPYYLFSYMLLATNTLGMFITNTAKKSITASNLKSIPILVPPIPLQQRFETMIHNILGINENQSARSDQLEKLFHNLLHRAFSGDLTARWREVHMKELLAEMEEQTRLLEIKRLEQRKLFEN